MPPRPSWRALSTWVCSLAMRWPFSSRRRRASFVMSPYDVPTTAAATSATIALMLSSADMTARIINMELSNAIAGIKPPYTTPATLPVMPLMTSLLLRAT